MQYFLAVLFCLLSGFLSWSVYRAIRHGVVQRPPGNAWWREARYYERDVEPLRFWISVAVSIVLALLAAAAGIQSFVLQQRSVTFLIENLIQA